MEAVAPSYKGFRFPVEIISHCVWLYHRFPLSSREVQEMMLERGVVVSHETVRQWCAEFGQTYVSGLRRRRPRPGDKWHLDKVFIKIGGRPITCGGRWTSTAMSWTSWSPPPGREGHDQVLSQAAEGTGIRAPGADH